jgi:hypothetical protein
MTNQDEQSNVQDERSQLDAIDDLKIADLRKVAKLLGISAQRDWTAEDFVRAIKTKQSGSVPSLVFDNSLAPKPGYARIIVHRDMTPGHKNTPIHVGVNGLLYSIPRGIEVDIPEPHVKALYNAKSLVTNQTSEVEGRTEYKDSMVQSYPFQVLAVTPGRFSNPGDGRAVSYARKKAFNQKYGRWPTKGELEEAMKLSIAKDL